MTAYLVSGGTGRGHAGAGRGARVPVVVGGLGHNSCDSLYESLVTAYLVLLQLPLVAVAPVADPAHEGLLPGVDPGVGHKPLSPEEALATSGALVGQVSSVTAGMSERQLERQLSDS